MVKNPITLAPDIRPDRPRRKVLPIISIFVVAPLLVPIIMDVAGALLWPMVRDAGHPGFGAHADAWT